MKMKKYALAAMGLMAGLLTAGSAFAWGHHGGARVVFGFNFGFPGYYYPAPYYAAPVYYPAPIVVQSAPPVYVERNDAPPAAAPAPQSQNYWYYCAGSKTYYPYVKECPGGWQRVSPTPQG
jgi:hypothetical protein